jgi:hypothetical protein
MRWHNNLLIVGAVFVVAAGTTAAALAATRTTHHTAAGAHQARRADDVQLDLTPSSPQLAACMPGAQLNVRVSPTGDRRGADRFEISGDHLPPNTDFTIFLLQQPGAPFGAAEYIGDLSTNAGGNAHADLELIVDEAFSSTLVGGVRTRVDLNSVGLWFADPTGDDFCLGQGNGAVTPFDGDNQAGVQAFNSANADPLPAP